MLLNIPDRHRHPYPSYGGRCFLNSATGLRYVWRRPLVFELKGLGSFGTKLYVIVDWDLRYCGIQAEAATLYVPQSNTFYSPMMVAESKRCAQIIQLRTHPGWPPYLTRKSNRDIESSK